MKIKLQEILDNKNISVYSLSKEIGVTQNNLGKLVKGETTSIKYDILEKLCNILNITPNDIFEIEQSQLNLFNEIETNTKKKPLISQKTLEIVDNIKHNSNSLKNDKKLDVLNESLGASIHILSDEENPLNKMTLEELKEFEEYDKQTQIRFERELKVDGMVSDFISKIIQAYLSLFGGTEATLMIFQGHEKYDYFTTELKLKKYTRILHPFLTKYSNDGALLGLLVNINRIYTNSGLDKLSDEELNDLHDSLEYYLISGLPIKKD